MHAVYNAASGRTHSLNHLKYPKLECCILSMAQTPEKPRDWPCREAMTRVAVQDMATGAQATVDCGALVHKVAVYSRRLAVQLSSQLLVYAVPPECPPGDLSLHMYARINACLPCNLLLVAAHHLLLCQVRQSVCDVYKASIDTLPL